MGGAMEMTHPTIRKYIDLFEQTFIVRSVPLFESDLKKRLVKSPKIYVRDSGLLHYLPGIKNTQMLFGHPVFGASWEAMVIEQVLSATSAPAYFYRTAKGDEMDLVLEINGKIIAIECKASFAPQLSKGTFTSIDDLMPDMTFIVAPIASASYQIAERIVVSGIREILQTVAQMENSG